MRRSKVVCLLLLVCATVSITFAQSNTISLSGIIRDKVDNSTLSFVNIALMSSTDSTFVAGTISDEEGRFTLSNVSPDTYILQTSYIGYTSIKLSLYVGSLSQFIDVGTIALAQNTTLIDEIVVSAKHDEVGGKMDKKVFSVADNISQSGGSVLQTMQNLPGVTVLDGKLQLRGNDKITVLIDGKQTALTGFGSQNGLDNIPASAIEKIEIINNPSSKFDANGNAGIINIIFKKSEQSGWNGKVGLTAGLGNLWQRRDNLPDVRPQYVRTPKINPSLSLNYRKNKVNAFIQVDNLYTHTLNKNEYTTRTYVDGTIINQQLKRNRNTNFFTTKAGVDYSMDASNSMSFSMLYGSEKILDNGDQPFFNATNSERLRLWQFLEDELKTTVMATASYQHKYKQLGNLLNIGLNYTFHREDEKYFFDNTLPTFTSKESFKLLSDEKVFDFNVDYIKPLKYGKLETGIKIRNRDIPTNMQFIPGLNSPLDVNAGGAATYKEFIPAIYGNYSYESPKVEAEIGVRLEHIKLDYQVDPNHNTYKSDGYSYTQPFPNVRFAYKMNDQNKISLFYNRRVDRPNEVDIRIFPKYDDAEIIKVGNPGLRPQFTQSLELGYKSSMLKGYFYGAIYHRAVEGTITRIASVVPNSTLIYAVFQNAGRSYNSGFETVLTHEVSKKYAFNLNLNGYLNRIDAFSVLNKYPTTSTINVANQQIYSGSIKLINTINLSTTLSGQASLVYLAPDIIPQGKVGQRFTMDIGIKKKVNDGKGEFFVNVTDLLNTMIIIKEVTGQDFSYKSRDYYETQVVRLGYSTKF